MTKKTSKAKAKKVEPTPTPAPQYSAGALYGLFANHPEGAWIMVPDNARDLYNLVKLHPIKNVLDLGTGIGTSAAMIALALKDKGEKGVIHTVEQFKKCYDLAQQLIPEDLQEYIKFHLVDPEPWTTDLIPHTTFSTFKELPDEKWDLICVDGPGPFVENGQLIDLPNGDVIKLLLKDKIAPGTIITWDGRLVAFRTLERYFGDNFYLTHPAVGSSDFNILERKNTPPIFSDYKLQQMRDSHYI